MEVDLTTNRTAICAQMCRASAAINKLYKITINMNETMR
jgi:hypothetical protein